jgi:hypothetical protein
VLPDQARRALGQVERFELLAEARRNFGDKSAGISDIDLRYRHREADLWANPETRRSLQIRSALIAQIRRGLWSAQCVEVETPMLNAIATGAAAKPFITHHNALDTDFFLRIAPELWLKRLVVGGFERVFEIGRVFRNEGISPRHNPEFTMLELYVAYWDVDDMMVLTEARRRSGPGRARHDRGDLPGTTLLLRHALASRAHGPTRFRPSAKRCRFTRRANASSNSSPATTSRSTTRGVPVVAWPDSSRPPARLTCGSRRS